MISLINTSSSQFLTNDDSGTSLSIKIVSDNNFDQWLNSLTSHQQAWVEDNHFKAANNELIKLADHNGKLASIVLGVGDDNSEQALTRYAKLAKSLAAGCYKIEETENYSMANKQLSIIGWALSQYKFDHYLADKNAQPAVLLLDDAAQLAELSCIVNGIELVRNLVNIPASDMGPSHLSKVTADLATGYGAQFSEIVGDELLTQGFNTIHAVGRAAKNQPRLLELNWGDETAPKLTLVGKGVCFDTGGLDLKSSAGMRLMKKDMGGAAHTLGIAQMIMAMKLKVRLRLLIPAVENNISADAFRPGDIIKTYKGTTVEVDNTDAEGRLVLGDALALASEQQPQLLIDFATLTGAAKVAMGTDIVPFFTDSDDIAEALAKNSAKTLDPLWRLPLYTPYEAQLKSNFADMRNMGSGPFGGALVAALYLKHFVDEPSNWVHFDMFAWNKSANTLCPEGGEAMAIRAVFSYLKSRFDR